MKGAAPSFWWRKAHWQAWLLWPLSQAYAAVAARRMKNAPRIRLNAPVLCVGNFTVGGSGKTPVAIALADAARAKGRAPGFLSRGHGGKVRAPRLVDLERDDARQVGDEPLLLARHAPVAVGKDRARAARLLIDRGCDFLIMDDGFQSARIHFDYGLVVIDAQRGVGNAQIIPAGPLRGKIADQLAYADALLVVGAGNGADRVVRLMAKAAKAIFHACMRPARRHGLKGKRLLAFAGIGNPDKFYETLSSIGASVERTRSFPDHHFYSQDELDDLQREAEREGLELVTTTKDAARLARGAAASAAFSAPLNVLEITMAFDPPTAAATIIEATLQAARRRLL